MRTSVRTSTYLFAAILSVLLASGCASIRTIADGELGSAKVMSGTRLDIRTLRGEGAPTKQFKAVPPSNPILDLPFSFIVDVVMLPLTLAAALFEYAFE